MVRSRSRAEPGKRPSWRFGPSGRVSFESDYSGEAPPIVNKSTRCRGVGLLCLLLEGEGCRRRGPFAETSPLNPTGKKLFGGPEGLAFSLVLTTVGSGVSWPELLNFAVDVGD